MTEIKDNVKQVQLLQAAKKLFWKYGIKRVSVEEISKEAGVSKMTFYRYFSNKPEIAKAVLDKIIDEGMQKQTKLLESDLPFAEKIKQSLLLKLESSKEISQEFILDIFKRKKLGLLDHMMERRNESLAFFMKFIKEGQEQGELRQDLSPEMVMYFLNKFTELTGDEKLLELYDDTQAAIMGITNFFFYGIGVKQDNSPKQR